MNLERRIRDELADLSSRAQLRCLEAPREPDFSSNDYLGLAADTRMKRAVRESLDAASRVASAGSRLLSGHDEAWDALEDQFARWIGTESALYFTTGYAANVGLLGAALRPEDIVFSDSANHASLIDGMRLAKARRVVFPHGDLDALEQELRRNPCGSGVRFIVFETVSSMSGDIAPLEDLMSLAERYGAELIADEAHATGVCGPEGRGYVAGSAAGNRIFATVYTCGKALAAAGAFVCGSESMRRLLVNRARTFIFSTALPPYFAAQVTAGMRLAASAGKERVHLASLGKSFRATLRKEGFEVAGSASHIIPVVLGSNDTAVAFASGLQARGYGIRAIRPPTVAPGTARVRISLTARHTESHLAGLAAAMTAVRDDITPPLAAHPS